MAKATSKTEASKTEAPAEAVNAQDTPSATKDTPATAHKPEDDTQTQDGADDGADDGAERSQEGADEDTEPTDVSGHTAQELADAEDEEDLDTEFLPGTKIPVSAPGTEGVARH